MKKTIKKKLVLKKEIKVFLNKLLISLIIFLTALISVKKTPTLKPVFNEKIIYSQKNMYKDGVSLTVEKNYMVPSIESGIVVYIGEKEDYGYTVIVEQVNGIDVFYSNINPIDIKIYDYVEKGSLQGETKNNNLYLVFQKNGEYLDYKKYI